MTGFKAKTIEAANRGLTAVAAQAAMFAKRGMGKGARHTSSPAGSPPNVQRGYLRNAIGFEKSQNLRAAYGVAVGVPYARIHELGGKITAKTTKYLPVPVNAEAKRLLEKSTGGLRNASVKLVPIVSRGGRPMLIPASRSKASKSGGPVFVLKHSATIPPRPYLRPALMRNLPALESTYKQFAGDALNAYVRRT